MHFIVCHPAGPRRGCSHGVERELVVRRRRFGRFDFDPAGGSFSTLLIPHVCGDPVSVTEVGVPATAMLLQKLVLPGTDHMAAVSRYGPI
jgi:hypothetical protein